MNFLQQSLFNSWLEQHPLITWCIQHPIISLISCLIVIILLLRLLSAIAQLLDRLWIWLLKSPILLIKSLFGLNKKTAETTTIITTASTIDESAKISQIIQQLEIINQQQQQIMKDIALLKKQDSLKL